MAGLSVFLLYRISLYGNLLADFSAMGRALVAAKKPAQIYELYFGRLVLVVYCGTIYALSTYHLTVLIIPVSNVSSGL